MTWAGGSLKENTMTIETYKELMANLDIIEAALNNVAKKVGHCSFDEFIALDKEQNRGHKKAA